jgi:hypothetical protein
MSATLRVTHTAIGAVVRSGGYGIEVDDQRVGSVTMNDTFETLVEPRPHSL